MSAQKIEYRVLTKMMYGWDDIWEDDKFETRAEAQAMIEDHVETCKQNNMEASLDDFKIIKKQEEKTKDEQQIEQLKKDIAENELVSFWKDEIKINSYKK